MDQNLHRVTCKVALFDENRQNVLLVEYIENEYGLPGGHLEQNEMPEAALIRELYEELGIVYSQSLKRTDFWVHNNGKVILGFVGQLDSSTKFIIDTKEIIRARWVAINDIKNGKISAGTYDEFIISNAN